MLSHLHKFRHFITLVAISMATSITDAALPDEKPIIKADFTVYSLKRLNGLKFLPSAGEDSHAINFYSSARSPIYKYVGTNPIVFFRESPAPTPENPEAVKREKVAEVNIPESGGEYLLLFFSQKNTEAEVLRIYPLADSTRDLPTGTMRFFNATTYTYEGILDGKRVKIPPGPSKYFRVSGRTFSLGLAFSHNGKFHQSFNSPVNMDTTARGLFMIYPPFVKGSAIVQTRFLRQTITPEEITPPNDNVFN